MKEKTTSKKKRVSDTKPKQNRNKKQKVSNTTLPESNEVRIVIPPEITYDIYKDDHSAYVVKCEVKEHAERLWSLLEKLPSNTPIKHHIEGPYLIIMSTTPRKEIDQNFMVTLGRSNNLSSVARMDELSESVQEVIANLREELTHKKKPVEREPRGQKNSEEESQELTRVTMKNQTTAPIPNPVFESELFNQLLHKAKLKENENRERLNAALATKNRLNALLATKLPQTNTPSKTTAIIPAQAPTCPSPVNFGLQQQLRAAFAAPAIQNSSEANSPQKATLQAFCSLFILICGFTERAFATEQMTTRRNLLGFALQETKNLERKFTSQFGKPQVSSETNNTPLKELTFDTVLRTCQGLHFAISHLLYSRYDKNDSLTDRVQQIYAEILRLQCHMLTSYMNCHSGKIESSQQIRSLHQGRFFTVPQQKAVPPKSVHYNPVMVEMLLERMAKPYLTITPVQHPYARPELKMKFQSVLATAINLSVIEQKKTCIPIQELYKDTHTDLNNDCTFFGSALIVRSNENSVVVRYINPLGSCYLHVGNVVQNESSVHAHYELVEKDCVISDIRHSNKASLENPGLFLSQNLSKLLQCLDKEFFKLLVVPDDIPIKLSIAGNVTCSDEQYVGGCLVNSVICEITNKPVKKWNAPELFEDHLKYLNLQADQQNNRNNRSGLS